ncbi:HPF/RaiA family ribosome-associated protein [Zoogloea sp.]|uniref:HPF/RaiA family ribosome-associated protein n=1 Tax=Zoogloea sp. TaxID=49181 RepID=UPI0026063BB4|nr:HPF/RaiA family ribosome-associated protein [Zoogloea sp.]MDD3353727.1 HPF/RaiA family ribosome-associated protein [Zoogloea sp.]
MEIQVKAKGLPTAKILREHAQRRIREALGGFGNVVQSVTLRLSDINGPHNDGVDKLAHIVVQLRNRSFVMEELSADIHSAIDRLAHRIRQKLARQLEPLLNPIHGRR